MYHWQPASSAAAMIFFQDRLPRPTSAKVACLSGVI
jgi:hypothetical protein